MAGAVKRFDEINITPLTDIFLVLLIIMMVVAPAMSRPDASVALPSLEHGAALNANLITVDVSAEGNTQIQGEAFEGVALTTKIEELLPTVAEQKVMIRADKQAKNSAVLGAMKNIAAAGVERVVFAGETSQTMPEADVETSLGEPVSSLPAEEGGY